MRREAARCILVQDLTGDFYVIPEGNLESWNDWCAVSYQDDVEPPEYATGIGATPTGSFTFTNPFVE